MPLTAAAEPDSRDSHSTAVVGESLFLWAGYQQKGTPRVHDSDEKRAILSHVEIFDLQNGIWKQQTTSGTPPLGWWGYGCVAVGSDLHYFGGSCGHGISCYHNSVHKLSTSSFRWRTLASTTTKGRGPMRKGHCGLVAFNEGEEDFIFVVGGEGPTPSTRQHWARYTHVVDTCTYTNEQHLFSLNTGE